MTKRELIKLLKKAGFEKTSEGANHEFWESETKVTVIPRHAGDLKKGTLHSILKQAGLK